MRTPLAREEDGVWGGRRAVFRDEDQRRWLDRMAARGFTAPTWPVEYGGAGLPAEEAAVLEEELRRAGCRPPLNSLGLWMLGPVLLRFGTPEQKREHLPPIARGEIRWCQGFSEPEAGSDLASLRTRAVPDGDDYIVTGQKLWTSYAAVSDWMFCLVRTSMAAPRHEGIGFLLIDLESPGITFRPIQLISGRSPFYETFFEGVRVPARNMVGPPNLGWAVAKFLLEHERASISRLGESGLWEKEPLHVLARRYLGEERGVLSDLLLRDRIAQADLDLLCTQLTGRRVAEAVRAGRAPGPESSVLKLSAMELSKRRHEMRVAIAGYAGLGWAGPGFTPEELEISRDWLRSRANSIEGGTTEIQLNIIAKRILGLPD
jgi:acyl-CoA dehydrogenase